MKVGDIITTKKNEIFDTWIIFDFCGHENEFICCVNYKDHKESAVFSMKDLINIEDHKVEWLFLKRREKNLSDIKEYIT